MTRETITVTPYVRERLKLRLIELGYGRREDLLAAVENGSFEELRQLREAVEASVEAESVATRAKNSMKAVFAELEKKHGPQP